MKAKQLEEKLKNPKIPSLWTICPKCHEVIYIKEIEKTNKCPRESCGYVYNYPYSKMLRVKNLLQSGCTLGELGKFVLELLDTIDNRDLKVAFLGKTHGLMIQWFEWDQMRKKGKLDQEVPL